MFWRKQLTGVRRRENLPATGSSVNQNPRPPDDLPRGRRFVSRCKLRPFVLSPFIMSRMADRKDSTERQSTRLDGYVYRRPLDARELIPAIGAGIVTGLAAFYVARLFLERTPLLPEERRLGKHHATARATG